MAYTIGDTTWRNGDEVTITSEPFELYGSEWQEGTTRGGKTITVPTQEAAARRIAHQRREWREEQDAYRRLRLATK